METVLPEVTVASVRMATSGTIRVVQSARDYQTTVVAVVSPPEVGIRWFLKDPIYRRPYFSYSSLRLSEGRDEAHVRLDKTQPGWSHWTEDSVITVTAMVVGTTCEASCNVEAWKFRRGGRTAAGSQDVLVPVKFAGSNRIEQHIERKNRKLQGCNLGTSSDRTWDKVPQAGTAALRSSDSGVWHVNYQSREDVADGVWHIDAGPNYFGSISVAGKLVNTAAGSRSWAEAEGQVSASFNGLDVPLSEAVLWRRVGGEQRSSNSVVNQPVEETSFSEKVSPRGRAVIRMQGPHVATSDLKLQWPVGTRVRSELQQSKKPGWTLRSDVSILVEVPKFAWIRFSPDF